MKKTLLTLLACAAIIGCKKNVSTTSTTTTTGNSSWTIGGTNYSGTSNVSGNGVVVVSTNGSSSITLFGVGSSFPSSSDSFKIVASALPGTYSLSMGVLSGGTVYTSNYSINQRYATVNVANGKLSITIPQIWVYALTTTSTTPVTDSLQFTATISQ